MADLSLCERFQLRLCARSLSERNGLALPFRTSTKVWSPHGPLCYERGRNNRNQYQQSMRQPRQMAGTYSLQMPLNNRLSRKPKVRLGRPWARVVRKAFRDHTNHTLQSKSSSCINPPSLARESYRYHCIQGNDKFLRVPLVGTFRLHSTSGS